MTKQKLETLEERFEFLLERFESLEYALAPFLPTTFVKTDFGYVKKDAETKPEQETEKQS
jgi:hypothetical protein